MAALRLGETFDAAFLERAHLGWVPSDPEKAVSWYRRARDLGNLEAAILLEEFAGQSKK
jgi:TPR repeat protein